MPYASARRLTGFHNLSGSMPRARRDASRSASLCARGDASRLGIACAPLAMRQSQRRKRIGAGHMRRGHVWVIGSMRQSRRLAMAGTDAGSCDRRLGVVAHSGARVMEGVGVQKWAPLSDLHTPPRTICFPAFGSGIFLSLWRILR